MREIKFRAFEEGTEKMHADVFIDPMQMVYEWTGNHRDKDGFIPSAIIMQYTGLKDKNGVEIFEGDVVQHSNITKALIVSIGGYIETYSEGHLANGIHIHTKAEDVVLGVSAFNSDRGIEVIGNIYQNPELLK